MLLIRTVLCFLFCLLFVSPRVLFLALKTSFFVCLLLRLLSLSLCPSLSLSVYLIVWVSFCLSVSQSVCLSRCLHLSVSVCLYVCLSVSVSLSVSLSLSRHVFIWRCEYAMCVWKFSCITFDSLIHAYMYINNACNLVSTHQQLSKDWLLDRFLTEPKLQSL